MATVVVRSISQTGTPDYSTPQAWEDAAPADLVALDQIWQGEIALPTDNYSIGGSFVIGFLGSTTDATRYKHLTAAAGASFVDHASPVIGFDTSKGCSIASTGSTQTINISESYTHVSRIQFNTPTSGIAMIFGASVVGVVIDSIISEVNTAAPTIGQGAGISGLVVTNSAFISTFTGTSVIANVANTDFINCLFVKPSDRALATVGLTLIGGTVNAINCAIMGATVSGSAGINYTNCIANDTSPPAGVTTATFTQASFVVDVTAAHDFSINTGSALKDAGATDARAAVDIFGNARPSGASYDVGVHEFIVIPPTVVGSSISLTGTPDYSTLQSWEDAAPANLVTANQIWRGIVDKTTDNFSGTTQLLVITGSTTDETRYKELTVKDGASFSDHASPVLRYDEGQGASVTSSVNDATIMNLEPYFRISRLQLENTGNASGSPFHNFNSAATTAQMSDCIFRLPSFSTAIMLLRGNMLAINCVFIATVQSTGIVNFQIQSGEALNCTFITPSDITESSAASNGAAGTTYTNCAFFGFVNVGQAGQTYSNCYADDITPPAGVTTMAYDTTTGSGFQNTEAATLDARIKETSGLIDAGATDARSSLGILGTARPDGAAYDVGAHEYTVTFASRDITPSGGIVFSGTAPADVFNVGDILPSGGIVFDGHAPLGSPITGIIVPGGGIVFGGTAPMVGFSVRTIGVSGDIVFGGTAPFTTTQININVISPSGGLILGGHAPLGPPVTIDLQPVNPVDGGIKFSGIAGSKRCDTFSPSGGISFNGTASASTGRNRLMRGIGQ